LYIGASNIKDTKTMPMLSILQSSYLYVRLNINHFRKSKLFSLIFLFRLLITCIYAKSLKRAGESLKAITLLQLEYSKAPHYTSLLYLYGKYTVTSGMTEFYGSAIGALDECLR
jgi:hypothetical protein